MKYGGQWMTLLIMQLSKVCSCGLQNSSHKGKQTVLRAVRIRFAVWGENSLMKCYSRRRLIFLSSTKLSLTVLKRCSLGKRCRWYRRMMQIWSNLILPLWQTQVSRSPTKDSSPTLSLQVSLPVRWLFGSSPLIWNSLTKITLSLFIFVRVLSG